MPDVALERGLPANLDAERFALGAVLLDDSQFPLVAALVSAKDFSLDRHRRIFARMGDLHERGERINRTTVANALQEKRQLWADGISYLVSLDDGLPTLTGVESFCRIIREKSQLRDLIFMGRKLADVALTDKGTPASEIAAGFTNELAGVVASDNKNSIESAGEILTGCGGLQRFTDALSNNGNGVKTGFTVFDQMTGGLKKGELIIIAARPSMGKTALAMNIAHHVSAGQQQLSTAVFSFEMTKEEILGRLLCSAARVDSQRQRGGYLTKEERSRMFLAAEKIRGARLFIDDSATNTVLDMHAKLRRLRMNRGLDLVVIDYLGLVPAHKETDNRVRELGHITRYLKLRIAKDLGVPVLLLSQLSRAPETRAGDHRPILSDLRESGDIEQDADLVAFIFREEVYKSDREDLKGLAELLVRKQRNGPTGRINLTFLKEFTRFEDRAGGFQE